MAAALAREVDELLTAYDDVVRHLLALALAVCSVFCVGFGCVLRLGWRREEKEVASWLIG